ncbi:MAG: adenylosuccinate synthetase [Caldiserica bacterium]|nr:MAG: adenylosuccinate synthetase [Caldisericota bacterium]
MRGKVSIIVGGHYGDEGKGKIISYLALHDRPTIVARAGVGPNAGHSVYYRGKKYGLRMIPCGFIAEQAKLYIGAGTLVDPERFLKEVEMTGTKSRVWIDKRCAIIEEKHKREDRVGKANEIGTTGSGCGPANAARVNRIAKQARDIPELEQYLADVPLEINKAIDGGEDILVEASQGFGLSLYYGNYPYVTSKDTTASSACADLGIGPTNVSDVIVVFKAYMSRVGRDPYINYLSDEEIKKSPIWSRILKEAEENKVQGKTAQEKIAYYFDEKGTVTGRPRKIAEFDYQLAHYALKVNGATQVALTCLDKLFPECRGARELKELSSSAKNFVENMEKKIGHRITLISTGPNPEEIIDLRC